MEHKMVAMYKGRPASELTHAELLEAYTHVCSLYQQHREFEIAARELEERLKPIHFYNYTQRQ
jgi:hypothetical protein